jgi:septum formation protein
VIVYLDGLILGKPKDKQDAINTLKLLSGKTHIVCTGYAIISKNKKVISSEKTFVTFNELSNELILDYVNSGLCMDKAGSYGIQDGYPLVKEIKGDYQNVVGLPINKIKGILNELL